jgi:Protein of unknown function (DUF2933)
MTIHIGRNALAMIGVAAVGGAGLALVAGVSLTTIFWFGLVLACPLVMLFMHGGHAPEPGQDRAPRREAKYTPRG